VKSKAEAVVPGFFNINKPVGITSHDVVARVRKIANLKQVGHAGTLDPLASGVMVVACGKATRLLRFLADDKTYLSEILLGVQTETDDMEGAVIESNELPPSLSKETVEAALENFRGTITQIPPIYSAIQVKGERLYKLARSGADLKALGIEIPEREVVVSEIELVKLDLPVVTVRVSCSKGTYIRSIARDLGAALGVGGTLKSLVRERSGNFHLTDAITLEQLADEKNSQPIASALTAVETALPLKRITLADGPIAKLFLGQKIQLHSQSDAAAYIGLESGQFVLIMQGAQAVVIGLVGEMNTADGYCVVSPEVVFGHAIA